MIEILIGLGAVTVTMLIIAGCIVLEQYVYENTKYSVTMTLIVGGLTLTVLYLIGDLIKMIWDKGFI